MTESKEIKKIGAFYERPKLDGEIGIELEFEATAPWTPLKSPEVDSWTAVHDNSLRNFGIELISKGAFKPSDVLTNLKDIRNYVSRHNVVHDSIRTSVHTHINVDDHTPLQVINAVCVYWLLEELLFNYVKPHRHNSNFCVKLNDAFGMITQMSTALQHDFFFSRYTNDTAKYGAINLAAVNNYGSLEFRALHGTCDPNEIERWVKALYHLVNRAKEFVSPSDVVDQFMKDVDKYAFLNKNLGGDFTRYLTERDNTWRAKLDKNLSSVLDVAYSRSWAEWERVCNKNYSSYGPRKTSARTHINPEANPFFGQEPGAAPAPLAQPIVQGIRNERNRRRLPNTRTGGAEAALIRHEEFMRQVGGAGYAPPLVHFDDVVINPPVVVGDVNAARPVGWDLVGQIQVERNELPLNEADLAEMELGRQLEEQLILEEEERNRLDDDF